MTAWLNKHKKVDLLQLADVARLQLEDGLLKDEVVSALDDHLRANASALSSNAAFTGYYERSGSPAGRTPGRRTTRAATAAPDVLDNEPRSTRRRRVPYVKQESPESPVNFDATPQRRSDAVAGADVQTPATTQHIASNTHLPESPLPASPAAVADVIERQEKIVGTKLWDAWLATGVLQWLLCVRELASSVVGVESFALAIEVLFLQYAIVPWSYAFDTPAISAIGLNAQPVYVPNAFVLLEPHFWSVVLLWLSTSVLAPLAVAHLFNFTTRSNSTRSTEETAVEKPASRADPLTYNVVKALVTYIVYTKGARFGLISDNAVTWVEAALPGGQNCQLIGAGIGALTTIYEAVLSR
ncbi:hypothetical protein K490DRAFT_55322 [Saccharata proteae CBS 121410]|uniref:Uncharacterized protein n=1 Tax=Saccharata proteae CBS 121410 TaxID=1314787 RepID=A0A6A5YG57_9PEZI|nr:hypothetical protein K490DRAFT_55322 [Saccharata proteae CBS 121410]